jgi:hypothetical protein
LERVRTGCLTLLRWVGGRHVFGWILAVGLLGGLQGRAWAVPASDGFDYPVGNRTPRDGYEYYVAQDFRENDHLGEDWNRGSGDTDLGDSVYAVSNGEVSVSDDFGGPNGWGQVIMIRSDTPDGVVTAMYAHLKFRNVGVGQRVRKGEWIGGIGKSGGPWGSQNSAHLHFEFRLNDSTALGKGYGNPDQGQVDPSNYIDAHRDLQPKVNFYDTNGRDSWTNDPNRAVVWWSVGNKDIWGQAWDGDPGQQFTSNDGNMIFAYIGDDNARQGWHKVRVRAWIGDRYWDYESAPYGFDSRAPTVSLTGGPAPGSVLKNGDRVYWHIDDPHSGIKHWGQAWDSDPGPQFNTSDGWLDIPEGTHTLSVHTWDWLDNNDRWGPNQGWTWTVLPPPPSNLHVAGDVYPHQATIAWNDNSSTEHRFQVWRIKSDGSGERTDDVAANTTTFVASDLDDLASYRFKVRAVADRGESDWSNEITVATPSDDRVAPLIQIVPDSTPEGVWLTDATNVAWTVTDEGGIAWITLQWDGDGPVGVDVSGSVPIPEGQHTVTITAEDARGNRSVLTRTYRMDSVSPVMGVTTPRQGSGLRYLTEIAGTAADATSGVRVVRVRLKRQSDGKWWKPGAGWVDKVAYLTVDGAADWRVTSRLPGKAEQPEGAYRIEGSVTDNVGHTASVVSRFTIDRQPMVSLTITSPKNGAVLRSLAAIKGTAVDNLGGSGVAVVAVELRRGSDGMWWNGMSWQTELAQLRTSNTSDWKVTDALPAGDNLPDGGYTLVARAEDGSGYRLTASVRFRVDNHPPVALRFSNPKDGAKIQALSAITGTAQDNQGGSGIALVTVELRRSSDGKWWNGTAWQSERGVLHTTNASSWAVTDALPAGSELPAGSYSLTGRAQDGAGLQLSASIRFRVVSGSP